MADAVLDKAVDLAREVAVELAEDPADVGDYLGAVEEGDRIVSHRFANTARGYHGWEWTVTVARVPRGRTVTVSEAALLPEWFAPAAGFACDAASYAAAWDEVLAPMLPRQKPGVTVLRDYHAENIMLLAPNEEGGGSQGLIDYQDALVGHPAYDLVSLLQDARRDVAPGLERAMLDHYAARIDVGPEFEADYARLGAQRNAKIVGIFARLWKRDGKPRYLAFIPRVWDYLERDLRHESLQTLSAWYDRNLPPKLRTQPLTI